MALSKVVEPSTSTTSSCNNSLEENSTPTEIPTVNTTPLSPPLSFPPPPPPPPPSSSSSKRSHELPTPSPPPTSTPTAGASQAELPPLKPNQLVFFFDIDNCLYPKSTKVMDMMRDLIQKYFHEELDLPPNDATTLHMTYYKSYGLALEGLVRHHQIDPLHYNSKVDDALPLESAISPAPLSLRSLLHDLKNHSNARLWLLTNAYVTHAWRVIRLLGLEGFFDGVTFCDYGVGTGGGSGSTTDNNGHDKERDKVLICKPKPEMYEKAMVEAGFQYPIERRDMKRCFFVDDSYVNCVGARMFGWENTVHLVEEGEYLPERRACRFVVRGLEELRGVFPELFGERVGKGEENEGEENEEENEEEQDRV